MARVTVESEIAGSIWKIEVEAGKSVSQGDTLLIIESMKMEIPVVAPGDGKVAEILIKEKDAVSEGQPLLMLET